MLENLVVTLQAPEQRDIEADGFKKKKGKRRLTCSISVFFSVFVLYFNFFFFFAPIILFQRVLLPFIHHQRGQFLPWKQDFCHCLANRGKSACVERQISDSVGKIPMIVTLFKGNGLLSARSYIALPRQTCMSSKHQSITRVLN